MSESLFKNIVVSDYGLVDNNVSLEDELIELNLLLDQSTKPVNQVSVALSRSRYLLAGLESSDRDPTDNEVELIEFSLESIHAQLRCTGVNGFDSISLEGDDASGKTKSMMKKAWEYLMATLKRILDWIKSKFKKFKSMFSIRQKKIDKSLAASSAYVRKSKGGNVGDGEFAGDPTDPTPWKLIFETYAKAKSKADFNAIFPKSVVAGDGSWSVDSEDTLRYATLDPMVYSHHPLTDATLGKFKAITDFGKAEAKKFEEEVDDIEYSIGKLRRTDYVSDEQDKEEERQVMELQARATLLSYGIVLSSSIQHMVDYAIRQFDTQFLQQESKP